MLLASKSIWVENEIAEYSPPKVVDGFQGTGQDSAGYGPGNLE